MAGLLGTKVPPGTRPVEGQENLCCANYTVRGSAKDFHYFRVVVSLESPKILGLQGIHSPEALK